MVNTAELRGIIAKNGSSQRKVAKSLGITEKTFYTKMKKGVFDTDEVMYMIKMFDIKNPVEIFFADNVTQ